MPGEEPEIMDTYVHEDGHDISDTEKSSSEHPFGSDAADQARGERISGSMYSDAADQAIGERASGPAVAGTDGTDSQPQESGEVLSPGQSSPATDGGQQ